MDLFEAFDTLNHKLLLKKLQAYGFEKNHFLLLKAILLTEYKELKQVIALENIRESLQEWHKDQSWYPSFSIFSLMIYFLLLENQPYVTKLLIIHFALPVMMQTLSLISWSRISRKYLNGSRKILWFLIMILSFWISGCPTQLFSLSHYNQKCIRRKNTGHYYWY